MWLGTVLILVGGSIYVFKACRDLPSEVVSKTGQALAGLASALKHGTVTTSFVSYATTVSNQQYLQFATLKQMEIFTREQSTTVFGYPVLPDVVVEARAPVEYTYYLDFNGKWQFVLRENVLCVLAPEIKFNKPAVDASRIAYEVKKGYFKTPAAQENLKQSITGLTVVRAKENIHLVRETGRKQVADFVERWLSRSFTDGKQYPVKVFFADEPGPREASNPSQPPN